VAVDRALGLGEIVGPDHARADVTAPSDGGVLAADGSVQTHAHTNKRAETQEVST
jgi:hypothetical protein